MTASAHIVTVGGMPSAGADDAAVAAALARAGLPAASRVFIEDDEAALERALRADVSLTIVLADPGGSAGEIVRRAVAGAANVRPDDHRAALPRGAGPW